MSKSKPSTSQLNTKRILLVDDDPIVLNVLGNGLSELGYQVQVCDNGKTAIDMYEKDPPDVVILDFSMPGLNGSETAKGMLASVYRPVIMLSAYNDLAIVREVVGSGISAYLVKPVDAEQLAPSIEAAAARFAEINALMEHGANIQEAMEKNRIINAAVGIIMERAGLPNDAAFERLRAVARQQRRNLQEVAFELVDALSTVNTMIERIKKR